MIGSGRSRDIIFNKRDLRAYLDPQSHEMEEEIAQYDKNALLNTPTDVLRDSFAAKYEFEFPTLHEEEISVEESETKIDVSGNFDVIWHGPGPALVDGTKITVRIPFTGQRGFLHCNPNQAYMAPPIEGSIEGGNIVFSLEARNADTTSFKTEIDNRIKAIKDRLAMMADDVANYNRDVPTRAAALIDGRKDKLKKDNAVAASLGFKMYRREDAPKTYVVPEVKRKVQPRTPTAANQGSPLEPKLDDAEFTYILNVVTNMVFVMERSPRAFVTMDEESIRFHFLVQLNGQYEGQANGETFNYGGKTDILVRSQGKNIFVAECKFWRGAGGFKDALKQLLGYATWRDGKLALLIFNRNKNFTEVVNQVQSLVEESPQFVQFTGKKGDTEFHFTMSHPDDTGRHLTLAVLLFDIPGPDNEQ